MFHLKQITKLKIHEILFYLLLFLLPIQTRILYNALSAYIGSYFDYHLAIFLYGTDLLVLVFALSWLILGKPSFTWNRLFLGIAGFLAWSLITLFHVQHKILGVYETLKWLEIFVILIYIQQTFRTAQQIVLSSWIVFTSAVLQGLLGITQFHVQHGLGLGLLGEYIAPPGTPGLATIVIATIKVIRAYGTFPHPNVLAAFLIFGLFSGFILFHRETSKIKQIVLGLGFIIIAGGIFVTFSRLAWIAAAVGVIGFLMYEWVKQRKDKVWKMAGLVGLVGATVLFSSRQLLVARATDSNPTSLTDRGFFDHIGLQILSHYPILGAGIGNYVPVMQQMFNLQGWQYQPAHNIFIFVAAELGIVGLLLFLVIHYEIFKRVKSAPHSDLKFFLVFLGIIILALGQFDHYFVTIQQGRLMFAVILGLLAALPNLSHEEIH